MAKLTDTQLIVLSKAAQRDDGAATLPVGMNKTAAAKVGASLIARKLMREMRARPGMPVWRTDGDERALSLIIMRAGRDAIGVDSDEAGGETVVGGAEAAAPTKTAEAAAPTNGGKVKKTGTGVAPAKSKGAKSSAPAKPSKQAASDERATPTDADEQAPPGSLRAGSKQALVVDMLSKGNGVTLDALVKATDWLPHTTRAALTGLRKRGFAIERMRQEGGGSTYHIVCQPKASVGA